MPPGVSAMGGLEANAVTDLAAPPPRGASAMASGTDGGLARLHVIPVRQQARQQPSDEKPPSRGA